MQEAITKDDLRQFGLLLTEEIRNIINENKKQEIVPLDPEWLKSRMVRKLLDISAGTLQNLRITGKVRYRKVLGSYYYNRTDLMQLFSDNK